jgi:O-antigen ligase
MEWGWFVTERQLKIFLFLPLLLLIAEEKYTTYYISAFLAGISVTEVISYLVWFEILHIEGISSYNPTPFFTHIHYNPMLAFAIYLLGYTLLFTNSLKTHQKVFVIIFIITMVINMFITGGRNGQILFFILTSILILQYSISKRMLFRGFVVLTFILVSVFATAYHNSDLFKERFNQAVVEVKNYSQSSHTSVGLRLQFWENTLYMSFNRPVDQVLFGSSPGDFPEDYTNSLRDADSYKMKPDRWVLNHPHSQYFYQLGALGIIGLLSLLLLVFSILYYALNIKDNYRHQRIAFAVFFIVVLIPNAQMLSKGTAHMIIALSVIYFSSLTFKKHIV